MLHLPPLPGAPRYQGDLHAIRDFILRDAETLARGGVHGLMLENFGDTPFCPGAVPAYVVATMTSLAGAVRRRFELPLGINVLRNDAVAALGVAHAVGAEFIRVNVLCGARVTDQGVMKGQAHELLRTRAVLGAGHIRILADVDVKHSAPLGPPRPLMDEAADLLERGGADALIVSGAGTGRPTDISDLQQVRAVAGPAPVFVGSGVTPETVCGLLPHADGFIVGTALKLAGVPTNPVDPARVAALVAALP
jgi:membrane complex biogenesis BtpA family protein